MTITTIERHTRVDSRRLVAEFLATGLLVAVVVGSGIQATQLTDDAALRLLVNALVTALGLGAIIAVFMPISGAHLNPCVTLALWWRNRGTAERLGGVVVGGYIVAQTAGAIAGAVVANAMFDTATRTSTHQRGGAAVLLAEVVATAGLLLVVLVLVRTDRLTWIPVAVGAWIGAAYWWTSSTSFANPAATVGRAFTDTYAGIAPTSVPAFIAAQLVGTLVAVWLVATLIQSKDAS